ncbi:MAG: hypothetical protein U0W40_10625 [Acidimicrobiia bacterium]
MTPFLFLPGFACPTHAYGAFLASIGASGVAITAHDPSRGLFAQVTGRSTPDEEAGRIVAVAEELRAGTAPLVLAGHSRGGFVAYLAAAEVQPAALVLVDPVSGGGPPWAKPDPLPAIGWAGPTLVLGCGKGGHCAPEGRNHEVFTASLAWSGVDCTHLVVDDSGHADMLDGHLRTMGRLVCSRGSDPDRARAALADHVVSFLRAHGLADDRMPG